MIANQIFITPYSHILLSSSFTLHPVALEVSGLQSSYMLWAFDILKG